MEELTTTIDEEKIKVDKAMIIVSGTKENHTLRYFTMWLAKTMTMLVTVRMI